MGKIEKEPSNSEKAYYYSLINKLNGLSDIMNDLKKQYEKHSPLMNLKKGNKAVASN